MRLNHITTKKLMIITMITRMSKLWLQFVSAASWVRRRWRRLTRGQQGLLVTASAAVILIGLFSYLTNPFVRFSVVTDPHPVVTLDDGQISLTFDQGLIVKQDPFFHQLARLKSSWHIIASRFSGGPKAKSRTVEEIIAEIHHRRFNPELPYLISGDHFSVFYPRSLGIFYHTVLDQRTALSEPDWLHRQLVYLKSLAYALEVYSQTDQLSTTIVPVSPRSVVLVNIYAYPSDTLYSLLYAFEHLRSQDSVSQIYPFEQAAATTFDRSQILPARQDLWQRYQSTLEAHFWRYHDRVYDPDTGLIRTDIELSGTKDIAQHRQSAFYDNVIHWRTHQLAQTLGLIPQDEAFLHAYKQRIITTFWLPQRGHFLEELSPMARAQQYYSSDWLIAFQTGFLDPADPQDLPYLVQSVDYIQRNAIDQPLAIQYQSDMRLDQLHPLVRWTAPEYGSTAIWSNWGMEYTKLLIRLYNQTGDESYLLEADQQLDRYAFNIKRYRGYPEVYNDQGDFFKTVFYKSIRQTGWVVTYEQARAMLDAAKATQRDQSLPVEGN